MKVICNKKDECLNEACYFHEPRKPLFNCDEPVFCPDVNKEVVCIDEEEFVDNLVMAAISCICGDAEIGVEELKEKIRKLL